MIITPGPSKVEQRRDGDITQRSSERYQGDRHVHPT